MPEGIRLVVYVNLTDASDLDWIRPRAVGAVEEVVEENAERLDGTAEVGWDTEDVDE
jgi:hypothetical protein